MRLLQLLTTRASNLKSHASITPRQSLRFVGTSRLASTGKLTGTRSAASASSSANPAATTAATVKVMNGEKAIASRKKTFSTSPRSAESATVKTSPYNKRTTAATSATATPAKSKEATPTMTEKATNNTPDPNVPMVNDKEYFPATELFDAISEETLVDIDNTNQSQNWSTSFYGLSTVPFPPEVSEILQQELNPNDIEIKPDGLLYLPEIKYRRILNKAFGPGGWGLAPRGEHSISTKNISREYALICHGRFISQARGEQDFFDTAGLPTASEGCKSNALMRCCKDLGIASELWDPVFIRKFKKKYCVEVWAEHVTTKRKKKLWRKKDDLLEYPYKENGIA